MEKGIRMNTTQKKRGCGDGRSTEGEQELGEKRNIHNHRPGHAGMDDQSAFYLLQSICNKPAHSHQWALSHITLLLTALSPLMGGLKPGKTPSALILHVPFSYFSKYPVTLTASCIRWPMVKTLPSYEKPQPFSASAKGMPYSAWTLLKRTQYSE